jgi:tRNA pseudouridine38-40 synthase
VRIDLAYDGTDFAGWARQPGRRTVAATLEDALATVLRLAVAPSTVVAGRTDAGVHASGQVCHVELPARAWVAAPGRSSSAPGPALRRRLAGVLPADVVVWRVEAAPEGFDARFSALSRRYAYRLADDPAGVPPLRRRDVLGVRGPVNVAAMDDAASALVGLHDFAAFCRRREGATTVRTLLEYGWSRRPDGLVEGRVVADAFCHSMVRALVGALLPVGQGRRPVRWPADVLAARVRDPRVTVVPPHGLVLEEVVYPDAAGVSARAEQARARRPATPSAPE